MLPQVSGSHDIVVVGAGHAGCEAAYAAARMGATVLLVTINLDHVAWMSCNPAVGGLAKGHLVREIDALGGVMGVATDQNGIQFRMLNTSKGPAVRAPRAQVDKQLYSIWMKRFLENTPRISLRQGMVQKLLCESDGLRPAIRGVQMQDGSTVPCRAVILATGTFLDGIIHIGERSFPAGRAGECSAEGLSDSLRELGLTTATLKTGTPARIDRRSVNLDILDAQPGDTPPPAFSYLTERIPLQQVCCHITHTNAQTHEIIRANLARSALYGGRISSVGPRYCPSIEDKCVRFPDRDRHQVFLEPEGLATNEMYVNGLSTSLPEDVQAAFLRTILGLENVRMTRTAYAIEYTYVPPSQILATMQAKDIGGLFLAGQINGTTGYEEAAAQGLLAAVNAVLDMRGEEPFLPRRDEAYIGVLADDLVTKEHREPYRMFTSRAEHRLLLRQDNADLRLLEQGFRLGLVDQDRYSRFQRYREQIDAELARLRTTVLRPGQLAPEHAKRHGLDNMHKGIYLAQLLARPEVRYADLEQMELADTALARPERGMPDAHVPHQSDEERVVEQVELAIKYEGYIAREHEHVRRTARHEDKRLPQNLDYTKVHGLTREAAQKLAAMRPATIGQASRIAGVNPADISVLLIHLKAREAS